jgi:CRISPR-associated endonuclease/helicase Cas3
VLEHHSSVLAREPSERSKLAVQNWDAPFIVTTTVQLPESLQPIVSVLGELALRYGCSVVLSTATQPALEANSRYLQGFENVWDIVPEEKAKEHFQLLKRVRYEVESDALTWDRVATELRGQKRAMAVVNTRQDAQELHEAVGNGALHLSASMCQAHRTEVLHPKVQRLRYPGMPTSG